VGVLPLKCFDMILAEDWLEAYGPMWVHWSNKFVSDVGVLPLKYFKVMRFTHLGRIITLQGLKHENKLCPLISDNKLKGFLNRQAMTQLCSAMF
jgi:hypothetical protein